MRSCYQVLTHQCVAPCTHHKGGIMWQHSLPHNGAMATLMGDGCMDDRDGKDEEAMVRMVKPTALFKIILRALMAIC